MVIMIRVKWIKPTPSYNFMMHALVLLWLFATAIRVVTATPFEALKAQLVGRDVELKEEYDFVVIGGGTSGLTVANRLTENLDCEFGSVQLLSFVALLQVFHS